MISILRDLPYFERETNVPTPTGHMVVRPFQIIVWVSLTPQHVVEIDTATPRFPAVLDTGNNHNFSLREEHLLSWAGGSRENHFARGRIRIAGQEVPLVSANVWLHRNKGGQRDGFSKRPALCLELPEGIAVYPPHALNPVRMPTLGLRALTRNRLRLVVDGRKQRVSLQQG